VANSVAGVINLLSRGNFSDALPIVNWDLDDYVPQVQSPWQIGDDYEPIAFKFLEERYLIPTFLVGFLL
jgi:hypothetical protein